MNLNHLPVFVAVAQARSFTRAAALLGIDKAQVSRNISALERDLGVVLLTRTTRALALTPEGRELAAGIAGPIASLEAAGASLVDRPLTPSGEVTLTTTPDLGRSLVAPLVVAFRQRYPAVRVRIALSNEIVPLVAAKADIALRVGALEPSALKAKKLGEIGAGFFAAPAYIRDRPPIQSSADLAKLDGLWPRAPRKRSFNEGPSASRAPAVDCDDFGTLLELARAGGGVAVLPRYLAARDVACGALVHLLPEVSLGSAPVYVITAPERPLPPRIAALRDFLVERVPLELDAPPRARKRG